MRVSIDVLGHQAENYHVATTVYEGPLDLLLQLIERAELDITTLALAQVTDQYLAHLAQIQERNPAEVSAFLVIAARLLQIKSAALLPRPPLVEASKEEESGEALARQLIQYRRFKQLAGILWQREDEGLHTYLRVAPPPVKVEARLDLAGITLLDLAEAARQMLVKQNGLTDLSKVVTLPRVTIREKISSIITNLRTAGFTTFRSIIKTRSRLEIVVTFLAMLELIKRHIIQAQQTAIFSDIELVPISELEDELETESEFGD